MRRRRIRHWLLLAMRAAAIALIVAAFARPFFRQGALAAAAIGRRARGGHPARSVGEHGLRRPLAAGAATRRARWSAGSARDDRATLVLFARNAEENMRATSIGARLEAAIDAAKVGSGATRYGPALKLAQSILSQSPLKRREAVLISDFQKSRLGRRRGRALPRRHDV